MANVEAGVIIQYVSDLSIDISTSDEDFSTPTSCQKLRPLSENISDELCAKVVYESKGQTTCPEIRALLKQIAARSCFVKTDNGVPVITFQNISEETKSVLEGLIKRQYGMKYNDGVFTFSF